MFEYCGGPLLLCTIVSTQLDQLQQLCPDNQAIEQLL